MEHGTRNVGVKRKIELPNPGFDKKFNTPKTVKQTPHFTHRLGQAMDLRTLPPAQMKHEAEKRGHRGPYMPVLIHASRDTAHSPTAWPRHCAATAARKNCMRPLIR
jgi:hypothetical protein